jgi:CRISPR type III-B/RAMP module RAMP protein Cmr6
VPDSGIDGVIGALDRPWATGRDAGQRDKDTKDANALLVLHRSAVLARDRGNLKLDDEWVRSWARATRLGQGTGAGVPAHVAARRVAALKSLCETEGISVVTVVATPMGAVVTGTGAGGIRNVGIELHGTYGWPVLPGSTLKGVAHSYARDEAETPEGTPVPGETVAGIFGAPPTDDTPARAGAVAFLDALPGPDGITVAEHVLTPHARGYRLDVGDGEEGDDSGPRPPAEYINPVPIPFLALTTGTFHIHLIGPQPEVGQAARLLADGLAEIGLGAKTTSGYGYFDAEIVDGVIERPVPEPQPTDAANGTGRASVTRGKSTSKGKRK